MSSISLLSMLGICSYEDIRWKRVGVMFILGFGVLGFILHLFFPAHTVPEILGGMAIGIVMFLISILSNESIGKGDALILTISGIYLGFWKNLFLLFGACLLLGMVGMVYLARGKRRITLPFVPFLLATYLVILITDTFGYFL